MIDLSLIIVILLFIIMMLLFKAKWRADRLIKMNESMFKAFADEREKLHIATVKERLEWNTERQQLLDRIQSPTFAEYKHQEVKVIKAKNGTDKPDIIVEQL